MEQVFIIWCGAMFFLRQISRKVPRNFCFPWCFFPKVPRNLRLLRWVCPKTGCMPPISRHLRLCRGRFLCGSARPRRRFCGDSRAKYSANFVKNSRTRYILRPFLCPRWLLLGGNVASTPQNGGLRTGKKVKKEEKFWQKNVFVLLLQLLSGVYHPFLPGGAEIIPLYLNRVMPA